MFRFVTQDCYELADVSHRFLNVIRLFGFLFLIVALSTACGDDSTDADGDGGAGSAGRAGRSGSGAAGSAAAGSGGSRAGNGSTSGSGGASGMGGSSGAGGAAGASGGGADPSAELYDPDNLPRFDVALPEGSIQALGMDPSSYVRATLSYDGTTVSDIGIRIKGEGSLRTLDQKAAFKMKFDEFVPDQTFLGLRRLTLNNMVEDPSFIAERLAYTVYRNAQLPAPRANSALVYVNGEYFGVYANVETEDKTFLRRWFADDNGNLYEEGQADFEPGEEGKFDLETNETANDRSDLIALIQAVTDAVNAGAPYATFLQDLSASLDTEHYLKLSALEALVNQFDMYSYTYFYPNNFRLYSDPTSGKFVFLPWGMDMALKPFPYSDRKFIPILEVSHYEDKPGERESAGLIFKTCLASPACTQAYSNVVRDMVQVFDDSNLEQLAQRYYAQVKDHVYEETRKETSNEEFDSAYRSLLEIIRGRSAAALADLE
jgi:hypothetical protein